MEYIISKKGDTGSFVRNIQTYLKSLKFYIGNIDADYGDLSENAVLGFQKAYKLPATGKVDTKTFEKVIDAFAAIPSSNPIVTDRLRNNKFIKKLPWNEARLQSGMNTYKGIVENTCFIFGNIRVVIWESKFDIDADGSGPQIKGDTYLPDTSLRDKYNKPLNSWELPFGVLPLDRSNGMSASDTGIRLGDLGIAFYKDKMCPFVYGDRGPSAKIGEGSAYMAYNLGINHDPVRGGLHNIPPGVIFVSFLGTANNIGIKTQYDFDDIWTGAFQKYYQLIGASAESSRSLPFQAPQKPPYPEMC